MTTTPAFPLHGALTVAHGQQQRDELLGATLTAAPDLVLDLSAVEAFDSAGVQLLLATRRSVELRGGSLALRAPSPTVCEVLHTYGLEALLSVEPPAVPPAVPHAAPAAAGQATP
jgi:anti-anti-sigma factor